jgi:WD40 repeat protein
MAANPNLWKEIELALDASEYYILLASPAAAASYWVRMESERWIQTKPNDHLLLALTDGGIVWDHTKGNFDWDQTTALPPTLRGAFEDQPPLWVDLRWAREARDLSPSDPRFTDAVVSLAAPIHDRRKDDLAGEEVRQQRRTIKIVRTAVLTLVILTMLAIAGGIVSLLERNTALHQAAVARSRQLAAQAEAELTTNPEDAVSMAAQGVRAEQTPQALHALWHALQNSRLRIELRQPSPVEAVAFSPDGKLLAVGSDDGAVRVWQLANRHLIWSQGQRQLPVTAVAFAPAGDLLAVARGSTVNGGTGCFVEVLSGATGTVQRTPIHISNGSECQNYVGFLGPTHTLAIGEYDGTIRLVNADRGAVVRTVVGSRVPTIDSNPGVVFTMAFSADGRFAASAGNDSVVRVTDLAGRAPVDRIVAPNLVKPDALAFSPDNNQLLIGSKYNTEIYDLRSRTQSAPLQGQFGVTSSAAWSPNGRLLAAATGGGTANVWRAESSRQVEALPGGSSQRLTAATFSSIGQLAAGSETGSVRIWDPDPDLPVRTLPGSSGLESGAAPFVHLGVFGTDNGVLVTDDGGREVRRLSWQGDLGGSAVGADGYLALQLNDSLRIVKLPSGSLVRSWPLPNESFDNVAISADGRLAAAVSDTGALTVFSEGHATKTAVQSGSESPDISLSPDGGLLAFAGAGNPTVTRLLRTSDLKAVRSEPGEAATFSPTGRFMAIQRPDLSIAIIRTSDWHTITVIRGASSVIGLRFSPDDHLLGAGGQDGVLRIWDASDGTLLTTHYVTESDIQTNGPEQRLSAPVLTATGYAVVHSDFTSSVDTYEACTMCLRSAALLAQATARLHEIRPASPR